MKALSRNSIKKDNYITVPNLFTTLNLFCGFLAVIMAVSGHYANSAWLIFIATVFDALDGRIARATGMSSQFGLEMDSLCDIIASGMAPSVLIYQVYLKELGLIGLFISFMPLLFAAFRLARFNVITTQSGKNKDFYGLPAPMAGNVLGSIVILYMHTHWSFLPRFLLAIVPVVSLLMASTITYEGYPRFNIREGGANRIKLLFFIMVFIFLLVIPEYTLPLFMMFYLLTGPFVFIRTLLFSHSAPMQLATDVQEKVLMKE